MPKRFSVAFVLFLGLGLVFLSAAVEPARLGLGAAEPAKELIGGARGLGDLGDLVDVKMGDLKMGDSKIAAASSAASSGGSLLRGPSARYQMLVDGYYSSGEIVDLSREVVYEAKPKGIVEVDATGRVRPVGDGEVTVRAIWEDLDRGEEFDRFVEVKLRVEDAAGKTPPGFASEVVPTLTKLGCNGGSCHGKSGGQNGFKLSLLGFYPHDDYEWLVKESRGRRVLVAAPDRSLFLLKVTGQVPHEGGERTSPGSREFNLLYRWMRQGMPYGSDDPKIVSLEVYPEVRRMNPVASQQLRVVARYADGTSGDITALANYESNLETMATVSYGGLVKSLGLSGEAPIMIRYRGRSTVFRATIPLGAEVTGLPEPRNAIDEKTFAKWKNLGIPPSDLCDDPTFLRRVTVDIAGRLPTYEEVAVFESSGGADRRDRLIERLLASTDYADYFANKWSSVLRNRRENENYRRGTYAFHDWLRDSLHRNRPYSDIVRDVLSASGDMIDNPPVAWYRAVKTTEQQVEDSAQLFLGLRIQCARCHHHPYEKWSQGDYYGYSAFFSRVGRKANRDGRPDEDRIFHKPGRASARNPRDQKHLAPTALGSAALDVDPDRDPRKDLVDWMVKPDNPFFAPALVNRYWKHFFGRGLVEPEDDMRVTNPPTDPALLDALAAQFIASGFDLKDLVRQICRSRAYQLSSIPNDENIHDGQTFARFYPKRLNAEVLYDALHQVTGTRASFSGMPGETRAVQLPDSGQGNYFLTVFGRPMSESSCECERSNDASLAQSLHLLNSKEILGKISGNGSRADVFAKDPRSHAEKVAELYRRTFARNPDLEELAIGLEYLSRKKDAKAAYEDIVWALLNTKEFLFNH